MEDFDDVVEYLIDEGKTPEEARSEAMAHFFGGDSDDYGGDGDGEEGDF